MTKDLFTRQALLTGGWAEDVRFTLDDGGMIDGIEVGTVADAATILAGPVVPGMPDVHSHAFQRAMAGLTERAGPSGDDFWTWRTLMYDFQARLDPDDIHAIAAQLYVELLREGYTTVGEFHYLHNQPDGTAYDDLAELSLAVTTAAVDVGIAITHLPVLYAFGGFDQQPLTPAQRRFASDVDSVLTVIDRVQSYHAGDPTVAVGAAPHSLRAVNPAQLAAISTSLHETDPNAPIHIHIAEQVREVEECVGWSGRRPVEWLLEAADVDQRWCLIHATHLADDEVGAIAKCGAVVGLCPTTEANLGDGVFRLKEYAVAGGQFGIGSDSNVSVSPTEELRWLEYGQRLIRLGRNVYANDEGSDVGVRLWRDAAIGGARALAQPVGSLEVGRRADLIVLDETSTNLIGKSGDTLLSGQIFAGNRSAVRDVYVAGSSVIVEGRHVRQSEIVQSFSKVMEKLLR